MRQFLRSLLMLLIAAAGIVTTVASEFPRRASTSGGVAQPTAPLPLIRVAMDGSGNAVCVRSTDGTIEAELYDGDAGTWGEPMVLATDQDNVERLSVVMHGPGFATVAWETEEEVRAIQYHPVDGWDAAATVVAQGVDQRRYAELATNTFGSSSTVFAIWLRLFPVNLISRQWGVEATRKLPGQAWQQNISRIDTNPTQTGDKPQSVFDHAVAMDGFGRAIVTWAQVAFDETGIVNAVFARRWNGQIWDEPVRLDKNVVQGDGVDQPAVGLDATGDGHTIYRIGDTVWARRYDVQTLRWNSPVSLGTVPGSFAPRSLSIAVNGVGEALAAWTTTAGGIFSSRYTPGGGWSPFQRVDVGLDGENLAEFSVRHVRTAIDHEGFMRILWQSAGSIGTVAFDARDGSWLFAEDLGRGTRPDLAMDASGRAVAVWRGDENVPVKRVWDQTVAPRAAGRIAFASYRDGDYEIYSMNPDGFDVRQHTFRDASDRDPSLSPDGSEIVFESDVDTTVAGFTDLYAVDVSTNAVRRLTSFSADFGSAFDPAWSPDGTEIAFAVDGEARGIFVLTLENGAFRQISDLNGSNSPSWSPDGTRIAFSAQGDLAVVPADGSAQPTLVENRPNDDEEPTWRDDDTLLFSATGPNSSGLQLLNLITGEITALTRSATDRSADYSPNNDEIVYSGSGDEGPRLFRMPAAGGPSVEIPDQEAGNTGPDWK